MYQPVEFSPASEEELELRCVAEVMFAFGEGETEEMTALILQIQAPWLDRMIPIHAHQLSRFLN